MSATPSVIALVACAPVSRRVRAYVAPVDRATGTPTLFDPVADGRFALETPPAPWLDLGWVTRFARHSGTRVEALHTGAPAAAALQVRAQLDATVSLEFESWGKLQISLASGSQGSNLLAPSAAAAIILDTATNASALHVGASATGFAAGDLLAVDVDYTGATGFIGSGISAAYVASAAAVGSDADYVRRVTWNVGLVLSVANGVLALAAPLPAGVPAPGMKVSRLAGFCDREGASFFQEWSALFVMDGEQGDRILFHYPRLQSMQGSAEVSHPLAGPLEEIRLAAAFRALPVNDPADRERVLCYRSYLPAPMRLV